MKVLSVVRRVTVELMALLIGSIVVLGGINVPASGATTPGQYQVVGNEVVGPNGQQFVPYGFVVYCLAKPSATCGTTTAMSDSDKIQAAATYWHADVVRIQVAAENLLTDGVVNPVVMQELSNEVQLANNDGMVAIITDQEEYFGGAHLPTASAIGFWNAIAAQFSGDPRVFFDLYNEPNLTGATVAGGKGAWGLWRNGGSDTVDGLPCQFVGMQTILDDIRGDGAQNVVIAEGLAGDKSLAGIPQFALSGINVAYGMEPDLTAQDETPSQWAANWGTLSASVPVIMEAFQDWPGAGTCNVDSPVLLPELLSYLRSLHLGLIVWALDPGVLVVGKDLAAPTTYQGSTTQVCWAPGTGGSALAANTNGPGQLVQSFFLANSLAASVNGPGLITEASVHHGGRRPSERFTHQTLVEAMSAGWVFLANGQIRWRTAAGAGKTLVMGR